MPLTDPNALAIEVIRVTPLFHYFVQAYAHLTGMTLNLISAEGLESRVCLGCSGRENAFCARLTQHPEGAEACRRIQNTGIARAHHQNSPAVTRCFSGLIDIYVPVIMDGHHVATIASGQVAQRKFKPVDFKLTADLFINRLD